MANINSEIAAIQEAARGAEVRQPMVDALNKVNAFTLPTVSSADYGKFLGVNSQGSWSLQSMSGYIPIPTDTMNILSNGSYDVTNYSQAVVSIPAPSGILSIDSNGSYDVTNYSQAIVDVQGSGAVLSDISISQNGTYHPSDYNVDGFGDVVVNVSGGGGGDDLANTIVQRGNVGSLTMSVTAVGSYAFYSYPKANLTALNFPNCGIVWNEAFDGCSGVTEANFPVCHTIQVSAFYGCYSMSKINIPACGFIGESAFRTCSALSYIELPVCSRILSYAFANCKSLRTASLRGLKQLYGSAFYSCTSLYYLYLGDTIPTVTGSPLGGTKISQGAIYVPASMVDAYKVATFWSNYASRIQAG